jgi:CheY-like chemotaxis protein
MSALLTSAGAEVETAASALEALRRLEVRRPTAVLADIGMPGLDGFDFIREIRKRDGRDGGRLAAGAITAYVSEEDRRRVLAAGFDCHVPKPINARTLIDAVIEMCPPGKQ